jgi:hypothetical protein
LLSRDGVIAHYILAFCLFFLSGMQLVAGWSATICGVLGTMEFASAVLWYSPVNELRDYWQAKERLKYEE